MIDELEGISQAENILDELGFETLPIVPQTVVSSITSQNFRVNLEFVSFQSDRILGKAMGNDREALIYVNENIPDQGRLNFTTAHEIGHVCMHIMNARKLQFECGAREITNPFNDPIEREANGFAAGLLLPKEMVLKIHSGDMNWANIKNISDICHTSLEATWRRLMLIEKTPHALVIHHNRNFKRFVASGNFDFYIKKTPLSIDQQDYCVDAKVEGYPDGFDVVDAEEWVNPLKRGYVLERIYSSSISLNSGYVYTTLAYDDECLVDDEE